MQGEFGDQLIHFEDHVGDDVFEIPATTARGNWYGVSGIPHVRIDGRYSSIGASSCAGAANSYRNYINQRLALNGGISPIAIEGSFLPSETEISATATFRLEDPANLTSLRATILVYEDNVTWCCGYGGVSDWDGTTRAIYDEYISLVNVGDEVTVMTTFPIPGGSGYQTWNPDECHVIAYLQTTSGLKEIHQGARLPMVLDFTFDFMHLVRSVPDGSGIAEFEAVLTNIGDAADTFTLEPGNPFGDWPTSFLVCGDPSWHTSPTQVVLGPGETCDVTIRVQTDGTVEERSGSFEVTSTFSERTLPTALRVFNGSYSVFLVDDDATNSDEVPLVNSLDALGYLYEVWDIYHDHDNISPVFRQMSGFDYVIWQTGLRFSQLLEEADMDALMEYMDRGGSLFLTSQEFLDTQTVTNTFISDYLGVSSWTTDTSYTQMDGVAGDPIGDGLTLTLDFNIPSFNQGDDAVPGATAETSFLAPDGSHAMIHNTMANDAKSVFMPAAFNAIVNNAPVANTTLTLERILGWLEPTVPADVIDGAGAILASRIDGVQPNPFNPRTEIAITLSNVAASGPVSLVIYDLEGRRVAGLLEGTMTAGSHHRTWDGKTDDGDAVRSGVYFARLTTIEGTVSDKLILLK